MNLHTMQLHYSNMEKDCITSSNSKLEKPSEEESKCKIYRVHQHLRNVNAGAYEPQIISIGPYHRGKDHLKMMENHKRRYLESLVERRPDFKYADAVSSVESSKARKCYADHQDFELPDDKFIEMLVLDGCFIVELVRKYAVWCSGGEKDDPIFRMEWMITSLRRDLMLFENQIPFFVLRNLVDLIEGRGKTSTLLQLLTKFFSNLYPAGQGRSVERLQVDDEHEIKHLLDLIHRNWVLPRLQQLNPSPNPKEVEMGSGNEENRVFINHATELAEANVEFKKQENETLLFDVYFEDGVMVMPPLRIEDGTECFLRNLIVYEQYFQHQLTHTVVTDYMMLLDNLIDSPKDVALLSKKGIIINCLGDAEVVANMVNKLGDFVICGGRNFSYATEFKHVNEHCKKRWNRWTAKLRRDYLNSPWAIISIITAVVLLLLTVAQTILSVLQVVQDNYSYDTGTPPLTYNIRRVYAV